MFTDNQYDILNRLDGMTSYRTDGTEADIADLSDNEVVADFDYEVRQDGRRTRLDERIEVDGVLQESTRTYAYDDLGRLIRETLDSDFDDDLDHVIDYAFDATGNRVQKAVDNDPVDTNGDGEITTADTPAFDVFTDYTFNAGDQLIEEIVTDAAQTVTGRTTHTYDGTQNSGKTEYEADGSVKSRTEMTYDLQGRLEVTDISSFAGGTLTSRSRSTYDYDATGIRIAALRQVDADGDGTFESTTDVRFLVDHANHTGYQQVLRESHFDADGNLVKQVDYTFGHDELHQTVKDIDAATGDVTSSRTDFFLHDGHGDVRALLNAAGAVATIAGIEQAFYYDAYGQLVNMTTDQAGTTLLYSGEQTDALTGSQYLRARYYNPNSGQFNRLDDFFGNHQDPQSLHKYAYVHGDPIQGIDPTGLQFSVGGLAVSIGIGVTIGGLVGAGVGAVRTGTISGTLRYAGYGAAIGGIAAAAIYLGAWGLARYVTIPLRGGTRLQSGLRTFSRFFNDPRTFQTISRNFFQGNAGGRSLHHWLWPQRLGLSQGMQNAGYNLLNMPGFHFLGRFGFFRALPRVGGLNQWMGMSLSWGGRRLVGAVVIENGIRVFIPLSIFGTAAATTAAVDWFSKEDADEEMTLPDGATARPLNLSADEARVFEEEVVKSMEKNSNE